MKYTDPRLTLLLIIALTIAFLSATKMKGDEIDWDKLSEQQKAQARQIYHLGKPYQLELTLISIAWQESRLGLAPVNIQDPSCGSHHINIRTYLNLHKLKNSAHNRNWYCNRLISDLQLSTATAIEVLLWYKNYHKGNYSKMIKSYNAGFNIKIPQADKYYKEVYHNVKILETLRPQLETYTEIQYDD